jgi:recombination protein RecA
MPKSILEMLKEWSSVQEIVDALSVHRSTVFRVKKKLLGDDKKDTPPKTNLGWLTSDIVIIDEVAHLNDFPVSKPISKAKSKTNNFMSKELLEKLEKKLWKWIVIDPNGVKFEKISSWIIWFDNILWWWYPKGRIIELIWEESSGKTTIALTAIAAHQQNEKKKVAFIDMEHALDLRYAKKLWVQVNNLTFIQPETAEDALEVVRTLIEWGEYWLIVFDSIAAMKPKVEWAWEFWQSHVWVLARLMSQAMRMLCGPASKNGCTILFINQTRQKIWVMFGNPETTPWWTALKFYATQRIKVSRKATEKWQIKDWDENIWSQTTVNVIKNKVSPPFRKYEMDIIYNYWVDRIWDLIKMWINYWLITGRYQVNWIIISKDMKWLRDYIWLNYLSVKKDLLKIIEDTTESEEELEILPY